MYLFISLILISYQPIQFNFQPKELKDFQWRNRIVIVFGESETSCFYKEQLEILESNPEDLKERKILLLKVSNNNIKDQFGVSYDRNLYSDIRKVLSQKVKFEVILIGLDGGVKLRKSKIVSEQSLFSLIDGMPMRRAEIKARKN